MDGALQKQQSRLKNQIDGIPLYILAVKGCTQQRTLHESCLLLFFTLEGTILRRSLLDVATQCR